MPPTTQTVLCGDARSMGPVASESIELVVTSPPYPMIAMWDGCFATMRPEVREALEREEGEAAWALMHEELDRAWSEVSRVLVPGGIACVNIGDATRTMDGVFRLYSNHVRILSALERLGLQSLPHILWRKQTNAPNKFMGSGMLPPGAYVTLEHEHILVLRKGAQRKLTSEEQRARRSRSAYFWEERNIWFSDVWDLKGTRQEMAGEAPRDRSGAFPLELAYRLAAMFSLQGDRVLDPFAGTGTTLLACAALGRSGLGIEIDPALAERSRRSIQGNIESLNDRTLGRLERHRAFVEERRAQGKEPAYVNSPHGFAVVTRQETGTELDLIERVVPLGQESVEVRYGPAGAGQLPLQLGEEGSP